MEPFLKKIIYKYIILKIVAVKFIYNFVFVYLSVFDPEGPLWIQVVDPENGEESSDGAIDDNAENEHNNAHKQKNNKGEELEPPSPSKPAYENTACLQKKRTNE